MQLQTSFTKDLKAPLTDEEQHERSLILARTLEEIADVEAEKSKIARQFAEKLKGLKLRTITLAHSVANKEEDRPVLCSERADLRRFQILTYRHDNSEVVDTRAMNEDELEEARQSNLFPNYRVATADKAKGGLDLASPPTEETNAQALAGALQELRNPDGTGETKVSHGFTGEGPLRPVGEGPVSPEAKTDPDSATITDPGAVLEGKVPPAAPSKSSRRRNTKGGLKLVDADPGAAEAPAAAEPAEATEPSDADEDA